MAAMEKCGPAHAGRLPTRSSHRGAGFPESTRTLQKRLWEIPRSHSKADVELHRSFESFAGRSVEGNQWKNSCRCRRSGHKNTAQSRPAGARFCMAKGRRHDRLWKLDLLWLL